MALRPPTKQTESTNHHGAWRNASDAAHVAKRCVNLFARAAFRNPPPVRGCLLC